MPSDDPLDKRHRLPRLAPQAYQDRAAVHWTLTTFDRQLFPLTKEFHHQFQLILLHTLARGELVCPIYCLMPDHVHMIWMGLTNHSDQLKSIAFFNTYLEPLIAPAKLQPQPYDHVLRIEELAQDAFQNAAGYIKLNPVRAGLCEQTQSWPYMSCMIPGYPKLHIHAEDYWSKFWRILTNLRQSR